MPKKLAIDWDETELRLVAAQCSGTTVKVIDAAVIPIIDGAVAATLQKAIQDRGLEKTEALVAIGRGKAELRDLELPEVPEDELPDMVRFQAIRSFASAGESATVDYLITKRENKTISMLAAAVGPGSLKEILQTCQVADLSVKRIALRPLAAASLYLADHKRASQNGGSGEMVLVDLLPDEAEIVVARARKVVFVRTVRLPSNPETRSTALAGELKRSLMACGSNASPEEIILWGRPSVHQHEVDLLSDALGSPVSVVDPFDLVSIAADVKSRLPEHVGRLAPLVGLLQSDEVGSHRLIDFLNPRKREIKEVNPIYRVLMIAAPIAAALLLGFFVYSKLGGLDRQIEQIKLANAEMTDPVKKSEMSVARTERVDQFLDGDVNWLDAIRLLANEIPASDDLIVKSISGTTDQRNGGGTITIAGGVTDPKIIDQFEASLRDDNHQVVGDGSKYDERAKDKYRWAFNEKVTIPPDYIRQQRYDGLKPPKQPEPKEPDSKDPEPKDSEPKSGDEKSATTPSESAEA